jgi:ADP-heptose:LPS heptosyltransferase
VDDVAWFSLQRGAGREQLEQPPAGLEIADLEHPDNDVVDSAAAILNLEVVITIDSMVAHLAGALGRPVWVLLPVAPDWRWLLDRTDSPWYPTARLFRQERLGEWEPVLAQVTEALEDAQRG